MRGQGPARGQAVRGAGAATQHVRVDHQPQDRQGARPDDPAVTAGASGRGSSVTTTQDAAPGKECSRCRRSNPAHAKFCLWCGGTFVLVCARCATALPNDASFCLECGQPIGVPASRYGSPETYTRKQLAEKMLTSKAALEGERKPVTVLFADLKGSMELLADRDPEEARKLLDPVLEHM